MIFISCSKRNYTLSGYYCPTGFFISWFWNNACIAIQAMRFGNLPPWANELSCIIRENVLLDGFSSKCMGPKVSDSNKESHIFPSEILWREPLFDQFIVNIYQPGEGICAHVDLMRFEDGITIISLESSCVMHFSSVEAEVKGSVVPAAKIPVLLTPGSLVLMWGEARYLWKHEINRKPGFQIWQGREINQKRRVSVTFRRLCRTE
ncbi:2-oxoglutarate (2OG) and Fe(II)-dependent oxygenase superfamily protein [Striga hermonthica]|uniref:2-oxoglutarate (2OG) and Fe(II)-dependent oxygenase superfamily protein n=1 Tax=Striga hermonthica TaxID=68872 RepID=A0A9N7RHK2_STRHE|nr:2-oxoglutarate (2OG) and Fe(II)-dependent oxygenase superfamily protein [Striga hermonthica]